MMHQKTIHYFRLPLLSCPFLLTSCFAPRNISYFKDISDTSKLVVQDSVLDFQATIQQGDILDIFVNSINAQATAVFNLGNVAQAGPDGQGGTANSTAGSAAGGARGYLVDRDGTIDFPVFGKVPVAGMTTSALRDTLTGRLADYLKDPVVNVRFLNYRVTVLGEVSRPATYTISGGKASLIDVLGLSGDLTIYGKRTDILVIRQEHGKRTFARLDLSSSKVFQSDYFYLKQNDIVYVQPNKSRILMSDDKATRIISIASGILTILVSVLLLVKL